jgi:hypothetical protein
MLGPRRQGDKPYAGVYPAATVSGRRALEGLFKYLVPIEKQKLPLNKLIEEVADNPDLLKPIRNLSHAIREGGNLGAHFDMEREPGAEIARAIIELLDYLVIYLHVLPRRIQELENKLS